MTDKNITEKNIKINSAAIGTLGIFYKNKSIHPVTFLATLIQKEVFEYLLFCCKHL